MKADYLNTHSISLDMMIYRIRALDPRSAVSAFRGLPKMDEAGNFTGAFWQLLSVDSTIDTEIVGILIDQPVNDVDKWNVIRHQRKQLLMDCDWTDLPSAPLTLEEKQTWQAYRQALRDLPQDFGDPDSVLFPQPPT